MARFGRFAFELRTGQLYKQGIRLKLQPLPARILALLILGRGEIVTREAIRAAVWGKGTFVDFENGLNRGILKIREALNDPADTPKFIETLPKIGYRFLAEVEFDQLAPLPKPRPVAVMTPQPDGSTPTIPPAPVKIRRRWLVAAPMAAAAAAAYWFSAGSKRIPGPVHLSLALPPHLSFDGVGIHGSPVSFSPDGSEIVVSAREGATVRLYRRKLSSPNFEPVPGSAQARSPVYSADGKFLLFVSPGDRQMKRVPLAGGAVEVMHGVQIAFFGIQQSQDGRLWFGDCGLGLVCRRTDGAIEAVTNTRSDFNEHGLLDNEHSYPEVLPGARKLIYTAWTSHNASGLQLLDLEKKTRTPLVRPGVAAKFLPRTGHLAYAWNGSLYSVPFDPGSGVRGRPSRVLQGVAQDLFSGAAFYTASSNGSLAYVAGRPQHFVGPRVWMDWNGNATKVSNLPHFLNNSRISPDGSRICFNEDAGEAGGSAIWVFEIATGRRIRITPENYIAAHPIWTPNGAEILFQSVRNAQDRGRIYRIRAEAGAEPRQVGFDSQGDIPAAVSSDGRWLLYVSQPAANSKPLVRILEWEKPGARSSPLPPAGGQHEQIQPSLSPGGRWVAMVSNELGNQMDVVIRSLHNPGRVIRISEGGGWQPVWSPHGEDLYYFDATGRRIMAAAIATSGDSPRIGVPRLVCAGPFLPWHGQQRVWDIHPDGKRFLVATQPEKAPRGNILEIILNWDQTLPGLG